MRRLLLRAAVLTGGCAAILFIGLSNSGEAHADDRPRLLDGLVRGTVTDVTDVLDDVLSQPAKQPKDKPKGEDNGNAKEQRDTPIRDVIEKVKDGVEDGVKETVGKVEDVVTTPAQDDEPASADATEPQPDTVADDSDEPAGTDETSNPADALEQAQQTPTLPVDDARKSHTAATGGIYTCGHEWHQQGGMTGINRRALVRIAVLRDDKTAAPGYTQPAPPTPTGPDQDVTLAIASPSSPLTSLQQDATLKARATMPRTTAVRIPGRDHPGDGIIRRPDPPSG